MSLVTLKTFSDPWSAHLLKTRLEEECIECFIFDENMSGLFPQYNALAGGV